MKIIYLDSGRLPTEKAHGLQIMKMCEAFADAGADVELAVSSRRNPAGDDAFDYYQVRRGFKIRKLWSLDLVNIVPKYGSWLSRLSFMLSARFYLMFSKYDVLYLREHISGLFFKDFVLEVHVLPPSIRRADLRVWQRARKLIVLTTHLKKFLIDQEIGGDKILVASDAVDIEEFENQKPKTKSRENLELPQNKNIIMYTGHLYEWKGADILLEAAKILPDKLFVFVGGTDWDMKRFRPLAEGVSNVLILGQKPHKIIPEYLAAADVLALPNSGKSDISKYYTSPLKMFEYMAAGRPIVASDLPSIREVLNEGNAVLVAPDDPKALADGIERVLKNGALSSKLGIQSLLDVEQYTWRKRAEKIIAFI